MIQLERFKRRRRGYSLIPFFLQLNSPASLIFLTGAAVGFALYPMVNTNWKVSSTEKAHIRACFSPEGQCTNHIISAIQEAQSSILIMAYSFTSFQIAKALMDAYERGIDVKILIDKSQLKERRSQLSFLLQKGILILIDPATGLAHNKTMIIDSCYVLTGSFNWTEGANSKNAENILLIHDSSLAQIYRENWENRAMNARKIKYYQ